MQVEWTLVLFEFDGDFSEFRVLVLIDELQFRRKAGGSGIGVAFHGECDATSQQLAARSSTTTPTR